MHNLHYFWGKNCRGILKPPVFPFLEKDTKKVKHAVKIKKIYIIYSKISNLENHNLNNFG
jgi:hypothetical protein